MKIAIKLKASEVRSLVTILEDVIQTENSTGRTEAIIATLMVKFYVRLKKLSIMMDKSAISISVEPETAMAFVEFFSGCAINNASHEGNTINKLIGICDKKTSNFY